MAKRRLNKKVALIGSAILLVVLAAAIVVVLGLSKDPHKLINDADAAVRAKDYEMAERYYKKAIGQTKDDKLREEILEKLVDMSIEWGNWEPVISYWNGITTVNPRNPKARFGRLKYLYIVADSGSRKLWQQVHKDATEFLEVAKDTGILDEDVSQWDVLVREGEQPTSQNLGAYLHLVRARALLEMVVIGAVTNKDESLVEVVADLEEAKRLAPENIDVYRYLAGAAVERGKLKRQLGKLQEGDKAAAEAKALLEAAVDVAPDNPMAHVNLILLRLGFAQKGARARDEIESLESDFESLTEKFPSSPDVFVAVSDYYAILSSYSLAEIRLGYLDKAIEATEKAVELDREKVAYVINAMNLHHRKSSIYKQPTDLYRSLELANAGLGLRDAQDTPGPWSFANKMNRFRLYSFLAHSYVQQILEPIEAPTDAQKQEWLANAEKAVHEIKQIFESGQEPQVIKWIGMLELAKGQRKSGVKKLYAAYEQFKALKPAKPPWPRDMQFAYLSYLLAQVFEDTPETGAVAEFLTSALYSGIAGMMPEARLDYVETIMKFNLWSGAIENLNVFEKRLAPNDRSTLLRIATYIGAGEFENAREALAGRPEGDPDSARLSLSLVQARIKQTQMSIARNENRELLDVAFQGLLPEQDANDTAGDLAAMKKELNDYRQLEEKLVNMLLPVGPNSVDDGTIIGLCRYFFRQGSLGRAKDLTDRFLRIFPENNRVLLYRQILSEPDPVAVSKERQDQIEEELLSKIVDPVKRGLNLGIFYRRVGRLDKAIDQLENVLNMRQSLREVPKTWCYSRAEEEDPLYLAVGHLFDIAVKRDDWALGEKAVEIARTEDIDGCEGNVYAARLAFARHRFEEARTYVGECLSQRPVFARVYSLRSNINAALGDEHAAIEDVRRATSLNPLDGLIAKGFAQLLYVRNKKAGDNVTPAQVIEARNALQRAMALNPMDVQLRSFFADFIAPEEPLKALAILQALRKSNPTFEYCLRVGELATQVARDETDEKNRLVIFAIAESAFADAMKMEPDHKYMLHLYTQYLRAMGRDKEVEQVLKKADEKELLWNHYYQRGQYEDAKKILEQLYKDDPENTGVLKGLLMVAEKMTDANDAVRYSDRLIAVDPSVDNYLIQVQSFLRVGLIKEAGLKLQSFTEKNPDEPRTLLLRAWLVMRMGQLEDAIELTNRYLEANPNNSVGWRLRGEINFYAGDMIKAINDFKRSMSITPDVITRIMLAKAYLRVSRHEDAVTELKNAIDNDGATLEARILLEETYLRLGRKDSLRMFYADVINEFPNSAFWLNRAGAFSIDQEDYDRAVQLYGESYQIRRKVYGENLKDLRFDALYATAFDGYLRALILQSGVPNTPTWNPKKLDEVFRLANQYLGSDYAPLAYLRMAQAKLLLGHKKTATEYCQKAVDAAETNEKLASEVLLRMFLLLGPQEVEKYCLNKLLEDPDSVPANFTMYNLMKANKQYSRALRYIDKCIQLSEPDSKQKVEYTAKKAELLTLAYQRSSDNKYLVTAIADYESLLKKMPNNNSVLNNLAYMLALSNQRLPEALKYAEKVYGLTPNDPGVLDTYGYVLYKNGKHTEALSHLTAALQQYEQKKLYVGPEVYDHLGMVKEALGDKMGALAEYKRALEVGAGGLTENDERRINEAIKRLSK